MQSNVEKVGQVTAVVLRIHVCAGMQSLMAPLAASTQQFPLYVTGSWPQPKAASTAGIDDVLRSNKPIQDARSMQQQAYKAVDGG